MDDDIPSSSVGIIRCLQSLAEETAALGLTRTHLILQQAIGACRKEAGTKMPIGALAALAKVIH